MRHKRLKLSALLLLGLVLTGLQAQTMYVKQSNGTQTAYALNSVRKMTFSSGNVIFHKTNNTTGVFALSGLKNLNFQDYATRINESQMPAGTTLLTYPNSVADMLNIYLTDTKNREGRISILNFEGKVMQTQKTSGTGLVTFNLSQLPKGIYLCRYASGAETKTVKIIKK